ncbi:hypothetical protein MMC07_007161 [Pseudocyphellaria aurata]|nr:hypothetical protein [Pseudocyphellaria aurata]
MHFSAFYSLFFLFASLVFPAVSFRYPTQDWYHPPLPLPVNIIHQFPVGTWLENIAIRTNGKILTTALSSPEIFQVDNYGVKPVKLVHTFGNFTSCTGIAKLGRDVFYVIAGNVNITTMSTVRGSWSVYKVDVRHHHPHTTKPKPAKVKLVANFPDSIALNGITVLSKWNKWLLVSDSGAGVIYRLEAKTGKIVKVIDNQTLMKPGSSLYGNGLKGMRIFDGNQLYFTNTHQNILGRMMIDEDGTSTDSATIVADIDSPDDFTFNAADHPVIAQNGPNSVARAEGSKITTLAGGTTNRTNSLLYGPMAVEFGKVKPFLASPKADWMKAYITTNGGTEQYLTSNVTRGGTISEIDIRAYW